MMIKILCHRLRPSTQTHTHVIRPVHKHLRKSSNRPVLLKSKPKQTNKKKTIRRRYLQPAFTCIRSHKIYLLFGGGGIGGRARKSVEGTATAPGTSHTTVEKKIYILNTLYITW
jgi:hypothetical protein